MILLAYIPVTLAIIALPVVLGSLVRRRLGAPWWLFCVGMATFVVSQVYHLPLNAWLGRLGVFGPIAPDEPTLLRTALLVGLSAGFCESLARAAGYALLFWLPKVRQTVRDPASRWEGALMVGLGHGGIEAMLVAVTVAATIASLWGLRGQDLSALNLSTEQLAAVERQISAFTTSAWLALAPLLERCIAILIHVVLSVGVWAAFRHRQLLYALAAVLYHALFDALAVGLSQFVTNPWVIEGTLLLLALPGAAWAWGMRKKHPPTVPPAARTTYAIEWRLFALSLGKELLQQWRSRRALVVGVVFLLFGLGSPLLAKFTPEMLRLVPGAEQFADLVPTPTAADAMGQYIKNLTQFGFILAVLLGMGAVAGEKERGTSALILSKPLPRWAFILSKFVAQALVYLLAFGLATAGAAYYTALLFEPLALGPFMFGNLLLWVWLLCFAAVVLLGSTLVPSTGAAAGIGFGGAVALLLAGSIPRYGQLAPAGLVTWASQLGLAGPETANGGALAAALVWIVVCLIASVAAFENQEL
ncbi:MAG: YhfC family intramembrane metalloprotease [Anaerolineae bacterium]|nr:YhfC family intramembrane metalloprotease [Anaerolineae bacterium]